MYNWPKGHDCNSIRKKGRSMFELQKWSLNRNPMIFIAYFWPCLFKNPLIKLSPKTRYHTFKTFPMKNISFLNNNTININNGVHHIFIWLNKVHSGDTRSVILVSPQMIMIWLFLMWHWDNQSPQSKQSVFSFPTKLEWSLCQL